MLFTTVAAATKNLLLLLSLVISCFFFFSSLEGDVYFLLVRNLSNQNQYFLFFFFPLPSRYTFAVTVHRLFKGDHYHHWILFLYHADTLKTKIKREIGKKKNYSRNEES